MWDESDRVIRVEGTVVEGDDPTQVKGVDCCRGCSGLPVVTDDTGHPDFSAHAHRALVEELLTTTYAVTTPQCEECEEKACEYWCSTCDTSLCGGCFDSVHAPKVMRRHAKIPHKDRPSPAEPCPSHGQPFSHYCATHSTRLCIVCAEGHGGLEPTEGHRVMTLEDASGQAVNSLRAEMQKLQARREKVKTSTRSVQERLVGLAPSCDSAETSVKGHVDHLRERASCLLDELEARLVKECRQLCAAKTAVLHNQNERLTDVLSVVTTARNACRDALRAKPVAVLMNQPHIASKLGSALSACTGVGYDPAVPAGVPVAFHLDAAAKSLDAALATSAEVGLNHGPRVSSHHHSLPQPAAHAPAQRSHSQPLRHASNRMRHLKAMRRSVPAVHAGTAA
eukprot:gene125-194_t